MKTWIVSVALLLVVPAVNAQQVYKCVGKGGALSYQSEPCAGGKASKTWAATPEPEPTNDELWRRHYAKKRAAAESRYLSNLAGRSRSGSGQAATITSSSGNRNACEDAKARRDRAVTNDTGIDGRRAWNDHVYDACK